MRLLLWAAAWGSWVLSGAGAAQAQLPGNGYTDALELRRARITLEDAKARFDRAAALHEQEIISKEQLREEETRLLLAQVELDRVYLEVIRARPRIIIEKAVKYQTANGRKRVRLELVNHAPGAAELASLGLDLPGYDGQARPGDAVDVVVSLKSAAGYREGILLESTIISDPYETRIPVMKTGDPVEIDIGLLVEDVAEVVVSIDHAGRLEHKQILLHKDSGSHPLSLSAAQTSLIAELGGEAVYDLTIERFTSGAETFKLETVGLPADVTVEIIDPDSQTGLRQVYFSQDVTTRYLQLKMKMPERPTAAVEPDRPLSFNLALLPQGALVPHDVLSSQEETTGLGGQILTLELVPRGVAKLEVDAVNLYHEVVRGEAASFEVTARNVGSLRLDRIFTKSDAPYGWRLATAPDSLPLLDAGKEGTVGVTVQPPGDVSLGEYEVRIWLEGIGGSRSVEAQPKVVRVHVRAAARWLGKASLLGLLTLILFVIVFYGVRFSRR